MYSTTKIPCCETVTTEWRCEAVPQSTSKSGTVRRNVRLDFITTRAAAAMTSVKKTCEIDGKCCWQTNRNNSKPVSHVGGSVLHIEPIVECWHDVGLPLAGWWNNKTKETNGQTVGHCWKWCPQATGLVTVRYTGIILLHRTIVRFPSPTTLNV
jgi:hypothetical protein